MSISLEKKNVVVEVGVLGEHPTYNMLGQGGHSTPHIKGVEVVIG
jgi:hypothetical protein